MQNIFVAGDGVVKLTHTFIAEGNAELPLKYLCDPAIYITPKEDLHLFYNINIRTFVS